MRGRFAPSPTGRLHLGNARSALLGWLQARSVGGEFLLRIEDLDPQRSKRAFVDDLMRDLDWLGLDWDGEPIFQSTRGPAYAEAIERLREQGRVYPCFCSRAEIARAASAPHGPADEGPRYPGTCARLTPGEIAERSRTRPAALRFRVEPGVIRFDDLVRGPTGQDVQAVVGDFVILSSTRVASYQLAVVVDDAASGVTDVLRADDLLTSTPRQIQLYRALGSPVPRFAHVPLVVDPDGRRLAKREGAFALTELREAGVDPRRVLSLLARWSGLPAPALVTARDLAAGFSLPLVPRVPVVTTEEAIRAALEGPGR